MSPRLPILLLAIALASACDNDWRTDMWYQPSHRPEASPRPEPERSVALGAGPRFIDRDDTEDLKNPVPRSPGSVKHGAWLFSERCACCHGAAGHGGGPVSKLFPAAPDLAYSTVRTRSDGYLFGTVTFGGRAMPAQAEGLTARDRWDLVNFIRDLQARTPAGDKP